ITNAHLFGAAPAPRQDAANAPQTSMPLVLSGIVAGNDPQNGLAILGPSAQNARVYAVGDSVPGGAKLHSVYSDRVLIDRDGQLESLTLPRQPNPGPAPPPSAGVLQSGPESSPIERMRRVITEQPGLLAEVLRPQPVMEHNHMNGFRVYPGRNRAAFMQLGLRPGDQVTAINGTPLDDRDRGEQILRTLASSSEARVTVIRGGQAQELNLNLAQLAQEADSLATQSQQPAPGQVDPAAHTGLAAPPATQPPLPPPADTPRRDRQELHHRPAGASAGDDAVLDRDDAAGLLRGVPLDPAGVRLHRGSRRGRGQDPARRQCAAVPRGRPARSCERDLRRDRDPG